MNMEDGGCPCCMRGLGELCEECVVYIYGPQDERYPLAVEANNCICLDATD